MKPSEITPQMLQFLQDRHLATLTTFRQDGSPHVVAVGFSYDAAARGGRAAVAGYAQRYQDPKELDNRFAVIIDIDRIMGRA